MEEGVSGGCLSRAPRRGLVPSAEDLRRQAGASAAKGLTGEAERLLRRAIEIAPDYAPGFVDLASLLCRQARAEEAGALLDKVLSERPLRPWALSLKAAVLETAQRCEEALGVHEELLSLAPRAPVPWMNYGHALKAVGRLTDAVAAYRRSLELDPANGFAWWGLANLRTVQLSTQDVALMERHLPHATDDLSRIQLHFALGKALGDLGMFEHSFRRYKQANAIRGTLAPYAAAAVSDLVRQAKTTLTPEYLAHRAGQGCAAHDPIFIVGMPRSGSTLIEQILASHPMIEGAGELPALAEVAAAVAGPGASEAGWPEAVSRLSVDELKALGGAYLTRARRFRRTDRPYFTDKMPANWQLLGLIRLILPNAKIIDARRHPLACGLSAFTTYFNLQTRFPTSLEDVGRHYRSYTDMIRHFAAAVPGWIHRVQYEHLVEDLESEARRMLAYLGLPFDEACLRFHQNPRAIYTPSAQQVRQPINRDGLERWRSYEPWLEPLMREVGDAACAADPPADAGSKPSFYPISTGSFRPWPSESVFSVRG
jgi:tetratricopeptide (TPR) repeat protein